MATMFVDMGMLILLCSSLVGAVLKVALYGTTLVIGLHLVLVRALISFDLGIWQLQCNLILCWT